MNLQQNINIQNNNLYPPPNVSTINNHFPLKIATFNINGLNDSTKQQLQNIQICGVSETNLNELSSKLIYKKNDNYRAFFTNNQSNVRGSGTGIVMTKDLAK